MKKNILLAAILIALLFLLFKDRLPTSSVIGENNFTVVISPFGTSTITGTWVGEVGPFMNALSDKVHVGKDVPLCEDAYMGYISNQPVLVVISGVGKIKTTTCLTSLLERYDGNIHEVILSGTSGISTNQGARIGDICINSVAGNFDMQHYSSDLVGTNERKPAFWSGNTEENSPELIQNGLVFELLSAANSLTPAEPPEEITQINSRYQGAYRSPVVFGMDECVEISGDLFWHDTNADIRAREIGSALLSTVRRKMTPQDTIIVTAMESITGSEIVGMWNQAHATSIDFAYVRGASNFDHPPLLSDGTPALSAGSSLESGYVDASIEFAAKRASEPVLKLFELREKLQEN